MQKSSLIQKIADYIEEHLDEDLPLDKIARELNYSKYYIARMFVQETGSTIYKYIQGRRLTLAAQELVESEKAIVEIAYEAHYGSQQAFTLAFQQVYLCTPQVYRRKGLFYPVQPEIHMENVKEITKLGKTSLSDFKLCGAELLHTEESAGGFFRPRTGSLNVCAGCVVGMSERVECHGGDFPSGICGVDAEYADTCPVYLDTMVENNAEIVFLHGASTHINAGKTSGRRRGFTTICCMHGNRLQGGKMAA